MPEQNKSVGWVAGMIALTVAYFGWGFLAANYFQNDPNGGQGETGFWVNTVAQLPNFPSVMRHAFQNRLWLIVLIVVAEVVVLILWGVMRKLERDLSSPARRKSSSLSGEAAPGRRVGRNDAPHREAHRSPRLSRWASPRRVAARHTLLLPRELLFPKDARTAKRSHGGRI
ncbi:MAG: hypothetical protein ACHRXM_03005 [Isosphaerales bacterium]